MAVLTVETYTGRTGLRTFGQPHAAALLIVVGGYLFESNSLAGRHGEVSTAVLLVASSSLFTASVLCYVQQALRSDRVALVIAMFDCMLSFSAIKLVMYPVSCSYSIGCGFGACDGNVLACKAKAEFVEMVNSEARSACDGYVREYRERRSLVKQ
jgi:hypothetical protein